MGSIGTDANPTRCPACLLQFKSNKTCNQHRHHCLVAICEPGVVADLVVREEVMVQRLVEAARFNSSRQLFELCETTGTVVRKLAYLSVIGSSF